MPHVTGLLESALYVDDPDRSAGFYRDVFGFEPIATGERLTAVRVVSGQVLLLFKKGASAHLRDTPHDGNGRLHVAFAIPAADLAAWEIHLERIGIPVEEKKTWDRGGTSLYFRDPDGHLLEVATPGVWFETY